MTCKNYIETVVATMGANNTPVEYQILSAHGKNMPVRSNPLNGTMALGQCYQNAYRLMDNRSMTYCEGYAAIKGLGIPIAHAWVVDSDGFVIDPTWKDGTEYFGVRFDHLFMFKTMVKTKHHGIFGNLYRLKMSPENCLSYLTKGLQSIAASA